MSAPAAPQQERIRPPSNAPVVKKSTSRPQERPVQAQSPQPLGGHVNIGTIRDQAQPTQGQQRQDSPSTRQEEQQRHSQEFSTGTSKARGEARERQTSNSDDQERPHQRGGAKSAAGGKKEHLEHSLFVKHITTNYPILQVTYKEVNNRLPIKIPNLVDLPLINRLPSPASLPVLSTVDRTLDSVLNRIDNIFPMLKSDPEILAQQIADVTNPWIAPANVWLVEHLPISKSSTIKDINRRRRDRGKTWSEKHAPGESSYADTAATNEGLSSGEGEGEGEEYTKQIDMEFLKTLAIFQGVVDAQLQKAEEARGYVAEVLLPGYVPFVGAWLGDKVGGKRGGGQKEKPGMKTGDEEGRGKKFGEQGQGQAGNKERGERVLGERSGEKVVRVGKEERKASEGVTVLGGREF